MYSEQPYRNEFVGTIAQLIAEPARARAEALRQAAGFQAQAKMQSGQAWGNAIQGIGQSAANGVQTVLNERRDAPIRALQIQQLQQSVKEVGQRIEANDTSLAANRRALLGQNTIAAAVRQFGDDPKQVADFVSKAGFPDLGAAYLKTAADTAESWQKLQTGQQHTQEQADAFEADQLERILAAPPEQRPALWTTTLGRMKGRGYDTASLSPTWDDAGAQQQYDLLKPKPEPMAVAPGSSIIDKNNPAAGPMMELPARPSNEQDDARYRSIQAAVMQKQPVAPADLAWASAYEKQKTLGPEATAAAAADRQAATIGQQNTLQQKAQDFQIAQAGRKELTEKVEQPYQTALASAQELRDVVKAAQAGNKIAGQLQNLLTTIDTIRSNGLNRINTAEIGSTANAGSLWDNIVSRVGKLEAGQPVPADLQKDMLDYAGLLAKSAYTKYSKGFDSTTKRYSLSDETKLPEPGEDAPQAPGAFIEAVDPQGNIHHAAAGTPLPAGWKLK